MNPNSCYSSQMAVNTVGSSLDRLLIITLSKKQLNMAGEIWWYGAASWVWAWEDFTKLRGSCMGQIMLFQQDNNPKHWSWIGEGWFQTKMFGNLPWSRNTQKNRSTQQVHNNTVVYLRAGKDKMRLCWCSMADHSEFKFIAYVLTILWHIYSSLINMWKDM